MNHFIGNGVRYHRWDARTKTVIAPMQYPQYFYCTGVPMRGFVMLWRGDDHFSNGKNMGRSWRDAPSVGEGMNMSSDPPIGVFIYFLKMIIFLL